MRCTISNLQRKGGKFVYMKIIKSSIPYPLTPYVCSLPPLFFVRPLICILHSAIFFSPQSLRLMHTGEPTGVAASHCITWFQTQLIITTRQICYHSHLSDHRTTRQLLTLIPRGCLEYHMVSRLCQLILVWIVCCNKD